MCGATEEDGWRQLGPSLARSGDLLAGNLLEPQRACRPFDAARQGTILSAGAAVLLLESWERRRSAPLAEIIGYGSAASGVEMFEQTGRGISRALDVARTQARAHGAERIDYVHAQALGLPRGDEVEARVLREAYGDEPLISSTSGQTGFSLGAHGACGPRSRCS